MSPELANLLIPGLLIVLLGFMFLSQRRRQAAVTRLQTSLEIGDDVCTTSGLFGRIVALDEVVATLQVAAGTTVRFDRRAIATKVDASGRPLLDGPVPMGDTSSTRDTSSRPADRPEVPRSDTEK